MNMKDFELGDTTELDKAIVDIVNECMDEVLKEGYFMFPHEWAGSNQDGLGGPVPKHPLDLYFVYFDDILIKVNIADLLLNSLSGLSYQDYYHQSFNDISTALRKLADGIDEMNNQSLKE